MNTPHPVFDLWCQWCVRYNQFVPFNQWVNYTMEVNPYENAILDYRKQQHTKDCAAKVSL